MDLKGDIIYSKALWVIISGTNTNASSDVVSHELQRARAQLLEGLNHYKEPNKKSEDDFKTQVSEPVFKFTMRLKRLLGLDINQAWDFMCHYLLYEFRGAEEGLQEFIGSETKTAVLLSDIWLFYRSERLFLLKCINVLLTFHGDKGHPYNVHFAEILAPEKQLAFFDSLISQLEKLLNLDYPTPETHGALMSDQIQNLWVMSVLREELELVQNLLLYVNSCRVQADGFLKLFKIILHHNFAQDNLFGVLLNDSHTDILKKIANLEVILLFCGLQVLGERGELWGDEEACKTLESTMSKLGQRQEHGPLNMMWMLINLKGPNRNESFERYGELALRAECIVYLNQILKHKMFKESARFSNVAFQTVYHMLDMLASEFDEETLDGIDGIYSLTATTLRHPDNIKSFFENPHKQGTYLLFQEAAKHFPEYFTLFSRIVESLSHCGPKYIDKLIEYLRSLPAFAEVLEPRILTTQMAENPPGEWKLTSVHRPMEDVPFVIKPGTKGIFNEENPSSIIWKCTFNFFYAVHHEILQLIKQAQTGAIQAVSVNNVISSLKCLSAMLNSKCRITEEMAAPLEAVFILTDRFCQLSNPSSELLASCLDCMVKLLACCPEQVLMRVSKMQFLPGLYYYNPTFLECISAEHINLFAVGTLVVTQERSTGRYPLLKSYLGFLHRLMKPGVDADDLNNSTAVIDETAVENQIRLVLPGVVFILRDVFPNYMFWRYVDEGDREIIALNCMQMIHQLLNLNLSKDLKKASNNPVCVLYKACLHSLLYLDAGTALLRIVGSGDHYIQALMEQQVSWAAGRGLTFIRVVQLALSVLNRLMVLKHSVKTDDAPCPLELNIFTQPSQKHGLKIVLVVANYIYHCFNPNLPALAMKLLRRFAMDMPKALMSCMGMKPEVVRHTFIARLNSQVESTGLKVALLELVTACIEHQPALADAFLNVHHPEESKRMFQKKQKKIDAEGGCLIFACSILSSIKQDPELVTGLLYQAVMNLIHALWTGHKKFVLSFLRSRSDFWDGFCAPLFHEPLRKVQGYSQLFDIIALELYWYSGNVDPKLEANLKKIFNEGKYLETWSGFIAQSLAEREMALETTSKEEVRSLTLSLAMAWKDFLIVAIKHLTIEVTDEQKYSLANDARRALITELEEFTDMRSIVLLAELCLILTAKWRRETIKDEKDALTQLCRILYNVSMTYDTFHFRVKEAVLAFALRLIHLVDNELQKDSVMADTLMQASCVIVSIEVYSLPGQEDKSAVGKASLTCTLSLCFMQKLLNILARTKGWQENFSKSKIVSKVLASVGQVLQVPGQFDFAVTLMNVLLVLSQTEFAQSIIHFGVMQHLWLQLIPPTWACSQETPSPNKSPELSWPRVYKPALEMITVLLQSQKHLFLDDVITFVGIHEEHIIASILAVRHSLAKWPLDLTVTALTLIRELSLYKYCWRLAHEKSMFSLMKSVMACLSTCVSYLIHPRLLKIMIEHPPVASSHHLKSVTSDDPEVSPHLVYVQNRLLDIVCLCMNALIPYSPNVVNLLTDFRECDVEWEPLVEVTFTAPTLIFSKPSPAMSQEASPPLTFGSLIAFANLCTSALGKTNRMPSPSIGRYVACSVAMASGLNVTWMSTMDKQRIVMGLELSLALIASQGIMYLMDHRLCLWEKQLIKREIGAEMALFLEFTRRNLRYEGRHSAVGEEPWNKNPNVVRRLWPGPSRTGDYDHECRSLAFVEESQDPQSKTQDSESTPKSGKRSWSSTADRQQKVTVSIPEEKAPTAASHCEDYFRLMAHIFNCIFR